MNFMRVLLGLVLASVGAAAVLMTIFFLPTEYDRAP